tara:strand:+ start:208 stop:567 length:360 start_codon:yes stop_codon:yes gene_type:complete
MILDLLFMLSFIPFAGLILTLLIEWGIYSIFIRKNYLKLLGFSVLINGLTNPLANIIFRKFVLSPNILFMFLFIEFLVIVVEVFLIKYLFEISYKKAIIISLIANIITGFLSIFFFLGY